MEVVLESGLSQIEIAEALDITPTYITLLKNRKKPISKKVVKNLANIYEGGIEEYKRKLSLTNFNRMISMLGKDYPLLINALKSHCLMLADEDKSKLS